MGTCSFQNSEEFIQNEDLKTILEDQIKRLLFRNEFHRNFQQIQERVQVSFLISIVIN